MMKVRIYLLLWIVTLCAAGEVAAASPQSRNEGLDGQTLDTLAVTVGAVADDRSDSLARHRGEEVSVPATDTVQNVVWEEMSPVAADSVYGQGSSLRLLDQPLSEGLLLSEEKNDSLAKTETQKARFLPTRRRIDREINRNRFIFKREVAAGLTVSYGVISSDETDFMLLLDNLNFSGSVFTINPSVGYFIKDNLSVGVRFGYSKTKGDINSLALNLGSSNDLDISLSDLHLTNNAASVGVFMRSYAGIDPKGHFGLFAELELSYKNGETVFSYLSNEVVKYTRSNSQQYKFSFNPGCAVFIFPNVCSTLSFGLGGLQYTKIKQTDDQGNVIGQREAAKMRFRLNLLNIRIGLNILL